MAISLFGDALRSLEQVRPRKPIKPIPGGELPTPSPPLRPFSGSVWATGREQLVPAASHEDTLEWALRPALLVGHVLGIFSCSSGPNPRRVNQPPTPGASREPTT
ncbi:uncharacterized protein LOC127749845 [Frankliniella occidentalis]|uniref:Uncharacterized protein LOC127749845 n=1 Tax=Frankliniella occidentalis TaxID=133901 RepID=A0A9C6UBH0_FRAOC|nr:uncharacterized protein LOC127749845 [Frankliniella occidentalis]